MASTPKPWNSQPHEMQQLTDLNAMERQQDANLWASNAIYLAANGVLLVAVATVVGPASPASRLSVLAAGAGSFFSRLGNSVGSVAF